MVDSRFWNEVKNKWSTKEKKVVFIHNNCDNSNISAKYSKNPLNDFDESILFDDIDYEKSFDSMKNGGEAIGIHGNHLNTGEYLNDRSNELDAVDEMDITATKNKNHNIDFDTFDEYMEKRTFTGYIYAAKLLYEDNVPEVLREPFKEIIKKMPMLDELSNRFKMIYPTDMSMFTEMYIPNFMDLIVGYYEYENIGITGDTLENSMKEILNTAKTLNSAMDEKMDEIKKFAEIEIKAQAKALNALLGANGFGNPIGSE